MSIIEHVVLIKVKEETEQSKINAMVNAINGLNSLDSVLHLTVGPILRTRSTISSFTHLAHCRFRSKELLGAYFSDPVHLHVAEEIAMPLAEDFMNVDWFANRDPHPLVPSPGSVIKITLLKLKPNVAEEARGEILGVIKERVSGIEQMNFGENFSESAKEFSIGSIAVFPEVGEMEAAEGGGDMWRLVEDKVRDYVDEVIVVDFVVPAPSSAGI